MSELAVLLVDDEKTVLDALKGQIRSLYTASVVCETAESVAEASEVLEELMSDDHLRVVLIVSDWLMPQVKGDTFLAEVKEKYPKIYRVMLTGHAEAKAVENVKRNALAHRLLFKPWSADEIRETMDSAFSRG